MELKELEVKTDERGLLAEAFKFPNDGQIFYVICNPGETRGNHYHTKKEETFVVIYGSATMKVRDRANGNVIETKVSGSRPMTIRVVPNNTHAITAGSEGCIFLVWANEIFDPENPDTIGEEI